VEQFSKDEKLTRRENDKLCYDYKTKAVPQQEVYDGLPMISFHLEGANFVIKPAATFLHDVDKNGK